MDDLISRKGVLLVLPLFKPDQNGYPLNGGIQYARAMIEAAPKMDAEFVRHGQWVVCGDGEYTPFMCSCCGKTTLWYHGKRLTTAPTAVQKWIGGEIDVHS